MKNTNAGRKKDLDGMTAYVILKIFSKCKKVLKALAILYVSANLKIQMRNSQFGLGH